MSWLSSAAEARSLAWGSTHEWLHGSGSGVALLSSAVAVWLANRAEAIGGARLVDVYRALVEHTAHTGVLSNHLAAIVRDETTNLSDQRCRELVADGNDQAEQLNVLIKSIPSSVRP